MVLRVSSSRLVSILSHQSRCLSTTATTPLTLTSSSPSRRIPGSPSHHHLGKLQRLVPAVALHFDSSSQAAQIQKVLTQEMEDSIDPIQKELLDEECILLNERDQIIGSDSKKNCHLIQNGRIKLHRAFSVFLFNGQGELLLQQRSGVKVTFPSMYTNTCCSHPLYRQEEMIERGALGIKRAAQRRLYEELGIPKDEIPLESFQYLTRIHYEASSSSMWGEHEIDYILFVQKDVSTLPNPNEIDDICYVTLPKLHQLKNTPGIRFTPWFNLILESGKLALWWNNLGNLKQFEDHDKIYKL